MNPRANILILSDHPEQAANLSFLLRLSNFHTIQISNDIEAFNYLIHHQCSSQPVSLLLITDADIERPILQLLDELERRKALLPVLLLRRSGPIRTDQLECTPKVRNFISQCDPGVAHTCARALLESATFAIARAS